MKNKNIIPWVIALALIWAVISWYWYVCLVKGFCSDSQMRQEDNSSVIDRQDAPVDAVVQRPVSRDINATEVEVVDVVEEEIVIECSSYLQTYIRLGYDNTSADVARLETFLNQYEDENLSIDGVFSSEDKMAVERFQEKYRSQVLDPWGTETPTGYVFKTTRDHINALYCAYEYAELN